jgi:hypothetical protein
MAPPQHAPPLPSSIPPSAPAPARPPRARPVGDSEATQYVTIPPIHAGELVGVLVGIAGDLKGELYRVFDGDRKLGRSQDCDIVLLDPKVSREHAKILAEGGEMVIIPLSEKNPVYVNDEKVEEADQLSDGDMLRLGNPGSSTFRFRTIEGL